jgi:hypothetical protein
MRLTLQNAILTKDNFLKRKWKGSPNCAFCQGESVQHLFFDCPVSIYIWSILAYIFGYQLDLLLSFSSGPVLSGAYEVADMYILWGKLPFAVLYGRLETLFDGKRVKIPTEVLCLISSMLMYWAKLNACWMVL